MKIISQMVGQRMQRALTTRVKALATDEGRVGAHQQRYVAGKDNKAGIGLFGRSESNEDGQN